MSGVRYWVGVVLIAVGVVAGVHASLRYLLHTSSPASAQAAGPAQTGPTGEPAPVIRAERTLAALKLMTVQLDTFITARTDESSWLGSTQAQVRAPVRFSYGVDLADPARPVKLQQDSVTKAYTLTAPEPRRLAVEVMGTSETPSVRVSGLHMRDLSGEYTLGRARVALYDQARSAVLTQEQSDQLSTLTKAQLVRLVRTLVNEGEGASVRVVLVPSSASVSKKTAGAKP